MLHIIYRNTTAHLGPHLRLCNCRNALHVPPTGISTHGKANGGREQARVFCTKVEVVEVEVVHRGRIAYSVVCVRHTKHSLESPTRINELAPLHTCSEHGAAMDFMLSTPLRTCRQTDARGLQVVADSAVEVVYRNPWTVERTATQQAVGKEIGKVGRHHTDAGTHVEVAHPMGMMAQAQILCGCSRGISTHTDPRTEVSVLTVQYGGTGKSHGSMT